jgi:hypothetical protein
MNSDLLLIESGNNGEFMTYQHFLEQIHIIFLFYHGSHDSDCRYSYPQISSRV